MKKPLVIFKTLQNQQIRKMIKLKKSVEARDIFEEASGNPEDQYEESSALPEVQVAVSRNDANTHKTLEYFRTMNIYVENIDKMTRINGVTYMRQLMKPFWRG